MSYGEVMIFMVQLDTWKTKFEALIDFSKLKDNKGYKFIIKDEICYLDPPTTFQPLIRWYNGYNKEQFYIFLKNEQSKFFEFLKSIELSNILKQRTPVVKKFTMVLFTFIIELSRSFSICRNMYPNYNDLYETLLSYYHTLGEWACRNGL